MRGEPIGGIISNSTQSFGIPGVSAVEQFNSRSSDISKIPFESLSPLPGRPMWPVLAVSKYKCVRVCVCVCVCPIWCSGMCSDFQSRGFSGSIPDDYGHTRLSSLSQTPPDFALILLGGCQQPVHAGVCGVMCVRKKRPKGRDSMARKSHFLAVWCRPG